MTKFCPFGRILVNYHFSHIVVMGSTVNDRFMASVTKHQKGETNLDSNDARDKWHGSGITWTKCKSFASHSIQITMPAPHHNYLQAGCSS